MTYDKKLQMDPDALKELADTVENVSFNVGQVPKYATGSSFGKKQLGTVSGAEQTADKLVSAVKKLADSIEKVSKDGGYLPKISTAIKDTAKAQKLNEEDAKWGFDKLEQGT